MSNSNLIKVVGVRITDDFYSKLKAIAKARGEDVSDFIRRAVLKELASLNFLSEFENKALGVNLKLNPWEEVIGTYKDLEVCEDNLTLTLSPTQKDLRLTFPEDSIEAKTLTEGLKSTPTGTKVAILRTDNSQKPIIIKTFNETPDAHNPTLPLLRFRKSMLWVAFKLGALKFALWLSGLRSRWWF